MPGIVRAQTTKPTKRLAMIRPAGPVSVMTLNGAPYYKGYFEELARQGYVEGQNLIIFRFSAEGHENNYGAVLQQAVEAAPDVIWCAQLTLLETTIAKKTTMSIPIVTIVGDPIADGVTTSLASPSNNITGVAIQGDYEIWGKRLSILKEAIEDLRQIRFLSKEYWWNGPMGQAVRQAAGQLGLSLGPALLKPDISAETYAPIFAEIKSSGADGLLLDETIDNIVHRATITGLAAQHRLPAMYPLREFVVDGGLLAYATDLSELFRVAAGQIASIFGGTKLTDIPFVQPTKYQLIANVKAAQATGLTLPPSLLLRADEVIE
jgi:putative ABC transport system substrate-binding protein